MSANAHQNTSAGSFTTTRRGGLAPEEIRMAEALRNRERPVSFQNIAARLGRCEADVRARFQPLEPSSDEPEVWPFGKASPSVRDAVRKVAKTHGVSLADLAHKRRGGSAPEDLKIWRAQREAYVAAQTAGRLTIQAMEDVFLRDKATICRSMSQHRRAA